MNRLGNVIVPNSSYGEIIETVLLPALEDIRKERMEQTGLTGTELWKGFGTVELCCELGNRVCDENSLLFAPYSRGLAVGNKYVFFWHLRRTSSSIR